LNALPPEPQRTPAQPLVLIVSLLRPASALDEPLPRVVNERWDALDLAGPVIRADTTWDVVDVQQRIRTYGS